MKTIVSKLALASIAMVGLFSSCVIDDIQTTFDLAPAECTINTHCVYALTGADVTSQCTITPGATYTLTANANKVIPAQDVTVTATFKTLPSQSRTVNVAALAAGAVATYDVYFVFGSEGDLSYVCELASTKDEDAVREYLYNAHFAHADGEEGWLYNDTEFIYDADVEYQIVTGGEVISCEPADNPNVVMFKDGVEAAAPKTVTTETQSFKVSAWSMYTAYVEHVTTTDNYDVFELNNILGTKTKIGSFSFQYVSSCIFNHEEKANPGHAGHYVPGHGHDHGHGHGENAGGGIIWAD